ncbi:phage holin family protein [Algoriphagus terrigena]|uniref:phage holin family protein n=1 Tax=Algoriphagus terrigena TaxID=344884 RepID=UPI00041AAB96|nr:phage holin family protein [Algoriphagus terrigena]
MLKIGEIVQTLKGIVETRIGIVKQEIQNEFVEILSRLILLIVIGSMLLFAFLFLSLSLAFFLSQLTKSPYMGFLIVALIYFLVMLMLILSRDSLRVQDRVENLLKNFIFRMRLKRQQEKEEDEQ